MIPMKKISFTFQEVLNTLHEPPTVIVPQSPFVTFVSNWFTQLLTNQGLSILKDFPTEITSTTINTIIDELMENVYNRHANDYIYEVYVGIDENYTLDFTDFPKGIRKILQVLENTLPKYIPMFIQNKKYSSDPVAPIKSKSEGKNRFNDTPQNKQVSGQEYYDNDYTTNITLSESEQEVDTGSIVSRLDEMFKNYRSILLEWSNEFNQVFLKEEQL